MMTIVDEVVQLSRTYPEQLRNKKTEGLKLVGYTGRYVPEELIHASGAVPYLLCRGGEAEPLDAVLPYMLRFMSPFARAQIGYHLLGMDPVLPMLDLIIAQCDDCHMSRLADLFEYFELPTHRIGVPADWKKTIARDYYYKGIIELKEKLETITGNTITDERLRKSVTSLNKVRELLTKISLLRKIHPPALGGYDFIRLTHCSFTIEPDEMVTHLEKIYGQLREEASSSHKKSPRILLAGHVVGIGDYVVLKLIEDVGGVIVGEALDEGMRHHLWQVPTEGDIIDQLVETYYLTRTPPSIFQPAWKERAAYLKQLTDELNIDGVIWYQLTFEEIYDMESSFVAKVMAEKKIPFLKLESSYEYAREAMGPLTTRVESFIESLKTRGGK
jgi:benzoyl-CoA reductase/2-hydroxyglutaryl-CoA dehydratase subunit BcrC/BadD/HgdB